MRHSPRNIVTFEGEHVSRSAGYHAPGSALKDWASLLAALSFSAATGIILAVTFLPELPQ